MWRYSEEIIRNKDSSDKSETQEHLESDNLLLSSDESNQSDISKITLTEKVKARELSVEETSSKQDIEEEARRGR
jgi:hypothetical protein